MEQLFLAAIFALLFSPDMAWSEKELKEGFLRARKDGR